MSGAVVVTGAASGIGGAIAGRLESDGWRVLSVDLSPDPDEPGEPFAADLATREGNRSAIDLAVQRSSGSAGSTRSSGTPASSTSHRSRSSTTTAGTLFSALKELIEPDEVADVVAYLLGPGGRAFTGAPVVFDGGRAAR